MSKAIQYIKISELKPHPLNACIYADGADNDLLESIKKIGIMSPIVATKNMLIISGHRRFNAAQMIGLSEVPIVFSEVDENDKLAIEELLIEANRQRQKTAEQVAREYTRLKEIEAEKARKRMLESGKNNSSLKSLNTPVVNLPQGIESGKSRDIAAKKLGVSATSAERSAKVIAEIDAMRTQGKTEEAEALRKTLNEKSVNAAWNAIKEKKEAQEVPILTDEAMGRIYEKWEELQPSNTGAVERALDRAMGLSEAQKREEPESEEKEDKTPKPKGYDEGAIDIAAINRYGMKRIYYLASYGGKYSIVWASTELPTMPTQSNSSGVATETGFARPDGAQYDTREEAIKAFRHYVCAHPCPILERKEDSKINADNALLAKLKQYQEENKALREQAKRDHDDYEKFCLEFNALVDEKKTLEAKILELSQEPSATTEAKPIQANEIQEKEIFYSTKQKAKYWYEKDGDSWVIIKLWANGEREITITLSSEDEAKKAMKRKITSNYLVREGEISKAEPDTKAKEEIERLRKERSEMYLQIADLEEKVLELKETSSPKARDFQEQEAKIILKRQVEDLTLKCEEQRITMSEVMERNVELNEKVLSRESEAENRELGG